MRRPCQSIERRCGWSTNALSRLLPSSQVTQNDAGRIDLWMRAPMKPSRSLCSTRLEERGASSSLGSIGSGRSPIRGDFGPAVATLLLTKAPANPNAGGPENARVRGKNDWGAGTSQVSGAGCQVSGERRQVGKRAGRGGNHCGSARCGDLEKAGRRDPRQAGAGPTASRGRASGTTPLTCGERPECGVGSAESPRRTAPQVGLEPTTLRLTADTGIGKGRAGWRAACPARLRSRPRR